MHFKSVPVWIGALLYEVYGWFWFGARMALCVSEGIADLMWTIIIDEIRTNLVSPRPSARACGFHVTYGKDLIVFDTVFCRIHIIISELGRVDLE